ncbi:hypothetical protein ACQ4PT_017550 [Festuca glaucescens]
MGVQFNLLSVYGPQLVPDKLQFLEDLRQHCPSSSPALLVGDFNLILKASDKNTNNYNRRTMAAFRRFTNDLELEDLYLHGRRYTWSNEQADAIKWNSQAVGDLKLRAAVSSELIGYLDRAMDSRNLTEPERQFRNMLKLNLLGIAALQRSHWRQRSRLAWLREGDANTSFFHVKATTRRRKKLVLALMHEGQAITGQAEKLEHIHQFFQNNIRLEEIGIEPIDLSELEIDFTETEIMAVHPPVWFIKRIGKAARGFLWANKDVATGGQCLISWRQVCSPKAYGGLGIPDLAARSVALRCRWLWQSWMDDNKPWVGLPLPIDDKVKALFEASVQIAIGDGEATQFWTDQWRPEGKLCVLFSDLFKLCTLRRITVRKALDQDKWIRHFMADLTPVAIRQDVRALVVDRARLPVSLIPNVHTGLQDWLISSSHRVGSANTKMWRSIVPLVWWCIWKERNERIFRHTASSPAELFQTLLSEAQLWVDAGQRRILALAEGLREPD